MKILFTGGSSFTGHCFVRELARAGHEVVAVLRRPPEAYDGLRGARVARLEGHCRTVAGVSFGDEAFLELIRREPGWDLLCHHAAEVTDYKSPDFDVTRALENNTHNLRRVLEELVGAGCGRVLLTGSVFECDEGAGSEGLPAFSPYGLSKALTAQVFRFRTEQQRMRLGKFVIPNPFGPWEEPRFTSSLVRSWYAGERPTVGTPAYVRDNIHVSLLARAYLRFAEALGEGPGFETAHPSGYAESQGAFARRFAEALRPRLGLACELDFADQREFPEPRVRINTDVPDGAALGWDEARAWDELGEYYREAFGGATSA